jgi:hypothetical protein
MSIADVRGYFDEQIKKVTNLEPYQYDVFGNNDLNLTEAQKKYNLIITNFEITTEPEFFSRIYNCQLDLWSVKGLGVRQNFDALIDTAEAIQENLIDVSNVNASPCIYRVEPLAYEAIEEPDNDNTFKVRLSFNVYSAVPVLRDNN